MKNQNNQLVYEPVAGLTIPEAFARAILMAKQNKKTVRAIINDIEMNVTSRTNLKRIVAVYQKKNHERYEAELRAYNQRTDR